MLQATIVNSQRQLHNNITVVQMTMAVLLSNNNDYATDENRRHIFFSVF